MSNKDKKLLYILLIVLCGFFYYQFGYKALSSRITELESDKSKLESKYDQAIEATNKLPKQKSDVKILGVKLQDHLKIFYPQISQEHIILELDELLDESGLKGNLNFSPITVAPVDKVNLENSQSAESSLKGTVDRYNSVYNNGNEEGTNNSVNNTTNQDVNTNASADTVSQVKINVTFNGTYGQLKSFLKAIDEKEKMIVVNTISVSQQSVDKISGTMALEIYAVPKPNGVDEEYIMWTLNNTYGKESPFSILSAAGEHASADQILEDKAGTSDFAISVKSNSSDLPSVMIGRSDDKSRLSYVYEDNNSEISAEMIISQVGDNYYYKYKTSNGCYPIHYSGSGELFSPNSQDYILLDILSEARTDDNDKTGLKLNLVNNTDKMIKVQIKGDDSSNPRVKVAGEGSLINVEQK